MVDIGGTSQVESFAASFKADQKDGWFCRILKGLHQVFSVRDRCRAVKSQTGESLVAQPFFDKIEVAGELGKYQGAMPFVPQFAQLLCQKLQFWRGITRSGCPINTDSIG